MGEYNYFSVPENGRSDVPALQVPYRFHDVHNRNFENSTQIIGKWNYKRQSEALFTVSDDEFRNGKAEIYPGLPLDAAAYGPYYATKNDIVKDLGKDSAGVYHYYLVKINVEAAYVANLWDAGAYQTSINSGGLPEATYYIFPYSWMLSMANVDARLVIGDMSTLTYYPAPAVQKLVHIERFAGGDLPAQQAFTKKVQAFTYQTLPPQAPAFKQSQMENFDVSQQRSAGATDGINTAHFNINEMYEVIK